MDHGIPKEKIARRAYALYESRGCEDGHDLEHWLQAERELVSCAAGDHRFEYDHYEEESRPGYDGPGTRFSVYTCALCGAIDHSETQDFQDIAPF